MLDQPSQLGVEPVDTGTDQPAAPASGGAEVPASEGAAPSPQPEWSREEVQQWREAYDNQHRWSKENTERAQYVADQQRAFEAATRQFYSDPTNRQIHELRSQLYNPDGTENAEAFARLERLSQGMSQGGRDPLTSGLLGKVRQLEGTVQQVQWAEYQRQQQAILEMGMREAEAFREQYPDEFPYTPDGERAFEKFMREEYPKAGTDRIADAYLVSRRDQVFAREREAARAEYDGKDAQALSAGSGLRPGAHEPAPPVEGDPTDRNFLGAQERSMQLYGDVDYES